MWVCKYCGKRMELKNKYTKSGHLSRCYEWKNYRDSNLSEESLKEMYIDRNMSIPEIVNELGLDSGSAVWRKLKEHSIETRTLKETANDPAVRQKARITNLERYGSDHNFNGNSILRKEMERNIVEKYGVENVFQLKSVKKKSRQTLKRNYGVDHPWELSLGKASSSSVHMELSKELKDMGICVKNEHKVVCDSNVYFVDMLLDDDLLVEVYGDYWHGNPKKYFPHDIILAGSSNQILVSDKWEQDKERINNIEKRGHNIVVVWEHDLNNNKAKTIKYILERLENVNQ